MCDFRKSPEQCATPLDFHAPLEHTLNVNYLLDRLHDYPNQQLLGFIAEGMRPWADVELQTVLVPHLMSLAKGFQSVVKEIQRMASPELRWYSTHLDFPFWPMYSLGEGCVPRKLENRWRRCEEGGGPRKETFDSDGVRALSLNEASRIHHLPRHFATDQRPEWLSYLRSRNLPATEAQHAAVASNRGTKWHPQRMPRLSHAMRSLLVLKRAAYLMQEPVYLFGDDVKDYFNHFTHASEVLHHMNTIFLDTENTPASLQRYSHSSGSLVFVHERRMGFGLHPNSIVAQDFSEALNAMLREGIDSEEDPILAADPRPAAQAWLAKRTALEAKVGGHQRRLYFVFMYCDDNIIGVVGVQRAMRVLKQWRQLTQNAGLIMAIPEKRSLGVWCKWVGALIFAVGGFVVLPKAKLLRASVAITSLMNHGIEFSEYRSLMGLLEHVRDVARLPRRYTHGLYAPHSRGGESDEGPNKIVHPNAFMIIQFTKWLDVLGRCGGCVITDVLRRRDIAEAPTVHFIASSDAATDSHPAGLGGFMHGFYWYHPVPTEDLRFLHITVLEMLACAFNAIIFVRSLPTHARITLLVDATAAYFTLLDESERSMVMTQAHHILLNEERFRAAAMRCDIVHASGDVNIAADAVSRAKWHVLHSLASSLRMRTQQIKVPDVCVALYSKVLQAAVQHGVEVRRGSRPRNAAMPADVASLLDHVEFVASRHSPLRATSSDSFLSQEVIEHTPGFLSSLQNFYPSTSTVSRLRPQPTSPTQFLNVLKRRSVNDDCTRNVKPKQHNQLTSTATSPSAMRTTMVHGVQLASVSSPRSISSDPRRAQREQDNLRAAALRAEAMASPDATFEQRQRLAAGLSHAASLAQFGASEKTLEKDDCAWAQWREFSAIYGFDPVVSRTYAMQQPDLLSTRLGLFLLWVYPRLKGRGRADAHPRSVLNNYPGAVARILRRDHKLPTPRASTYEAEARGLLRGYKRVYGTLALAPRRRQPMTRSLWRRVEALSPGQSGGRNGSPRKGIWIC